MSTSKLQAAVGDLLDKTFPHFSVRENYRPDWLLSSNLTRLELDFYIDELNIAFEIQGRQHYEYTPFFHSSPEDFKKRKQYDDEKRDLCYGHGVRLIEIDAFTDACIVIREIESNLLLANIDKNLTELRIREKIAINKYKNKYNLLLQNGDPKATHQQKSSEISKFMRLVITYRKANRGIGFPYHEFKFLGAEELKILLGNLLD